MCLSTNPPLYRTCIQDTETLNEVRGNLSYWYKGEKEVGEGQEKKTVPCIYTNISYCDETPGAELSIKRLFDIPVSLRKSSSGQYLTKEVLKESISIEAADFGTSD